MAKDRKIDLVILGLLFHEDLTGYDIKKRIDGAISFFWKGSFGSIYPALADMEKAGLVERRRAQTKGRREKILYHITDEGTAKLKEWLNVEQVANDLKYETMLKLYFGGAEDKGTTLKNICCFERVNITSAPACVYIGPELRRFVVNCNRDRYILELRCKVGCEYFKRFF